MPACREAADLVADLYRELGVDDIELLDADDGSVVVVGYTEGPAGAPRVLLYAHYDVQPAGELWKPGRATRGRSPTARVAGMPVGRRGPQGQPRHAPDGAAAPRGRRRLAGVLTVVCEGSEEMSSGGLERLVAADPDSLRADVIVGDTGNVEAGVPTVTTSLRGTGSVLVTVRTLEGPVHSGAFGGALRMRWRR